MSNDAANDDQRTKLCRNCEQTLAVSEFYWNRKYECWSTACKPCTRAQVKSNRDARIDYYREYDRARFDESGKRGRASVEAQRRGSAAWRERNPDKRRAHVIVGNAVRSGRLVRQPCSVCGSSSGVDAHHPDYSKPLDVVWLCETHHAEQHKKPRDPNFQMVRGYQKRVA